MSVTSRPAAGIGFALAGLIAISANDVIVKLLSGDYPLHQLIFTRSAIGIAFSLALVQVEGGWRLFRTGRPLLHALRAVAIVFANMAFFAALAALPLAEATAIFFVAPLFITLLSIPVLGERVGPARIGAVLVGFAGVLVMQRPWAGETLETGRVVLLLPVVAALAYAIMQVMTRMLGATTRASVLAAHIQAMFLAVSLAFYLVAGDGRFADPDASPSVQFLLRAWIWPVEGDWPWMIALGLASGVVGYCLSQAYRLAGASTIAPFEYAGLPLAVFWGWLVWSELPDMPVWIGMVLIAGAGLVVFVRERRAARFQGGGNPSAA